MHVSGYYVHNGMIYTAGQEILQREAYRAYSIGISLIKSSRTNCRHIQKLDQVQQMRLIHRETIVIEPLTDPWFWLNVHLLTRPISPHTNCGSCDGCECGSCDKDGCLGILLVLAICVLISAILVTVGFTINQGDKAAKIRSQIKEVQKKRLEALDERVGKIYEKALHILKEKYINQSLQTAFSATAAAGICLLTVSACLALDAVLHLQPFSPLVNNFAIAGGSIAGMGLLAHSIRPIAQWSRKKERLNYYLSLFEELNELRPLVIHPHQILREQEQNQVYLVLNEKIFAKCGKKTKIFHLL
jgi:hypothetical protein